MALENIIEVHLNSISPRGQEFEFFVATGSSSPPIVCMGVNERNPPVLDLYAIGTTFHGKDGAHVKIRFNGTIVDSSVSINLLQADMTESNPEIENLV